MKIVTFFSYFTKYIIFSKTRQRLLFIAVSGLFLSAFSLMVIQGIMGGLQKGLVSRSKNIHGSYLLQFRDAEMENVDRVKNYLLDQDIAFYAELETEVMIKSKGFVAPAKFHGVDLDTSSPLFLENKDLSGIVLGSELASKIKIQFLDDLQIIAPGVTDSLMGEVPRFIYAPITDYYYSELPEVDEFEMWGRLSLVQNLLRVRVPNQIRIFGELEPEALAELQQMRSKESFEMKSWEVMNEALVWSLNLETKVMLFLFGSMSFLVSIAITSGLLIFFSKIRKDLMSFWILGMGQKQVMSLCFWFIVSFSFVICLMGLFSGFGALKVLEIYGHSLIPDIFVERRFPLSLTPTQFILSFGIPFLISLIFSYLSFLNFKKENQSFVSIVRGLGQ